MMTAQEYLQKWPMSCPTCRVQESEEAHRWREAEREEYSQRMLARGIVLKGNPYADHYYPENSAEGDCYGLPEVAEYRCDACTTEWKITYVISEIKITNAPSEEN